MEKYEFQSHRTKLLLGAAPWALSRLVPVFLALAFGGGLVENVVGYLNGDLKVVRRWIIRCRSSLTSCRFCNFTSLFTSKKHFPYLILGFVLTALLTTVFSNIQLLGSSVASVVKDFSGTFNALPMLAIALIGFAFAAISYKKWTSTSSK